MTRGTLYLVYRNNSLLGKIIFNACYLPIHAHGKISFKPVAGYKSKRDEWLPLIEYLDYDMFKD